MFISWRHLKVTIYLSNLDVFLLHTKPIYTALIYFYMHYMSGCKNKKMALIINYVHLEASVHGRIIWCHHCEVKPFNLDFTVWKGNSLSWTTLTPCHISSCIFCWPLVCWPLVTLYWFSDVWHNVFVLVEIVCANISGNSYTFATLHLASIRPALPSGLVKWLPYPFSIWTAYIHTYC